MDTQLVLPGFVYAADVKSPRRRLRRLDPSKGALIVFEGADRTGKTTLAKALAMRLGENGYRCLVRSFPGHDPGTLGKVVYDVHHRSGPFASIEKISQAALQVAHTAAHIDEIEHQILPALAEGYIVILDRFWWSSWAYGTINGVSQSALKLMVRLENQYWGAIKPHMLFLLQRELSTTEQYAQYHSLVSQYEALADRESRRCRIQLIQNNHPIDEQIGKLIRLLGIIKGSDGRPAKNISNTSEQGKQAELYLANSLAVHLDTPACIDDVTVKAVPEVRNIPASSDLTPPRTIYINKLSPAKPTLVFDTYWHFAAERQNIFFNRLIGNRPPWTSDPILTEHKFTNAYRASDRVSQYLISNVICRGEQTADELFFRIIFFKIFNRIETWELLVRRLGNLSYREYSFEHFDNVLTAAIESGDRIYSAAYIMPSGGPNSGESRKHRMHLKLIERMMKEDLPLRISDAKTMAKAFELLRSYPTIGDFLAYQYVTDLNYSILTDFEEKSFVVPGPGAKDGIRKCFTDLGGLNEAELIKQVTEIQDAEFERLNIRFLSLWGRKLQPIDCQNLFCEVDKYARVKHPEFVGITGRTRIKQKFKASQEILRYWYPPKWGINEKIPLEVRYVP